MKYDKQKVKKMIADLERTVKWLEMVTKKQGRNAPCL